MLIVAALYWRYTQDCPEGNYAELRAGAPAGVDDDARALMQRIDAASVAAGLPARLAGLPVSVQESVAAVIADEAQAMAAARHGEIPAQLDGRTIVIEFARGGPEGASMPLPAGRGYRAALAQLSAEILARAVILYIWVTPEESRRKNAARADPSDPGSILHHGVPEEVMRREYGCDDMDWLERSSSRPGTVEVHAHGRTFFVPMARFDNRHDRTSFIRAPRDQWAPAEVDVVHRGLHDALDRLHATWRETR